MKTRQPLPETTCSLDHYGLRTYLFSAYYPLYFLKQLARQKSLASRN